jgi:sulfur carrier protein
MPAKEANEMRARQIRLARFFIFRQEFTVKLTVNGEVYEAKRPESVTSLLEEMGIGGKPVVVVLNDEVIPASSRSACGLREGDNVELFRLVGGG